MQCIVYRTYESGYDRPNSILQIPATRHPIYAHIILVLCEFEFFSLSLSTTNVPCWISMVSRMRVCCMLMNFRMSIPHNLYNLCYSHTHKYHSNQHKSLSFVMLKSQLKHSSSIETLWSQQFPYIVIYMDGSNTEHRTLTMSDFDENHFCINECFCLIEVTLNEFPST